MAMTDESIESHDVGRRRGHAAIRSSGGAVRCGRAADRGCARARAGGDPDARPRSWTSSSSSSAATCPTVRMPRSCSFAPVTRPTPHSLSTGRGWRKSSSPSGGTLSNPFGFATALATLARNFVRAMPDRDREPDLVAHLPAQPLRDHVGRSREPLEAADVEERFVDRDALDERRRVLEDGEHGLARVRVGGHPRGDDDGMRAEAPRLPAAHRRSEPNAFAS